MRNCVVAGSVAFAVAVDRIEGVRLFVRVRCPATESEGAADRPTNRRAADGRGRRANNMPQSPPPHDCNSGLIDGDSRDDIEALNEGVIKIRDAASGGGGDKGGGQGGGRETAITEESPKAFLIHPGEPVKMRRDVKIGVS